MIAAREGENNRKEEDDASGSLFRRPREGSRAQSGNISPGSQNISQVGDIVCFTNKESRLC
jgi:hypothetical protein